MRRITLLSSLLFAAIALNGCNTSPQLGHWQLLPHVDHLWRFGFDSKSHPLVGSDGPSGGMWRYTDDRGWLKVGTLAPYEFPRQFFPANDGGTYSLTFTGASTYQLYKLGLDVAQWTKIGDYPVLPEQYGGGGEMYVSADGVLFYGSGYIPVGTSAWQLDNGTEARVVDRNHTAYFFPPNANATRREAGSNVSKTLIDCHTAQFQNCNSVFTFLGFVNNGTIYFSTSYPLKSIFSVPVAGGTPTLVATLPYPEYVYDKGFSLTDNGTIYYSAARSSDAYSYGSTFRFALGDTKGQMIFASPSDFYAPDGVPLALEATFMVAPDGTYYAYLPGPQGGAVERYVP